MRINLCLSGFGNIGHAFVKLLSISQHHIAQTEQLDLRLIGVVTSKGAIHSPDGLDPAFLAALPPGSDGLSRNDLYSWEPRLAGVAGICRMPADILVEATPTDLRTGEPGLAIVSAALNAGMDIVSFSKGAFVKGWREISALANARGKSIKLSGATAAALPTIDLGYYCLAGAELKGFVGILNGTANYILSRMEADGIRFDDALREAQSAGIAEPDPSLDIDGWDTAAKTLILANILLAADAGIDQITVTGIRNVTPYHIQAAAARGERIKLVGEASKVDGRIVMRVAPLSLPLSDELARVSGGSKAIRFSAPFFGDIFVAGGGTGPLGTAAAGMKDIINLGRQKMRPIE